MNNAIVASIYGAEYLKVYQIIKDATPNRTWSALANQIQSGSKVLEFGSASGYMTRYLTEELSCDVYIAEIDPNAAKQASIYATDCFNGDIETYDWERKWNNQKFDVIMFADVLEHLKDPWKMLGIAKNYLAPRGKILASLPNICHNSVIIELWNNRFNYQELGLLDKTHLRFFSEQTARQLFSSNDLTIEAMSYMRIKKTELRNSPKELPWLVRKALKKRILSDVYQFVITATPNH